MELPTTFTLGLILLLQTSCGLFENEQDPRFFTATPVSAVEVALEIRAEVGQSITIHRDGADVFSFRLGSTDTVVIDSGLEPATSYIWEAQNGSINMERQATTLDTTSHAFTWQKYEFGEDTYSFIYDVAVIDENNIWAVGEIYMNDSLGEPETTPYNAAHWDGQEWEILRVPYYYNGSPFYSRIRRILAFDDHDIWFGVANLIYWDGVDYHPIDTPDEAFRARINRIWGTSSEDFYLAGDNGSLAHYNGKGWQKLESGTQLNINDIWGSQHPTTGEWEILAVASEPFSTPEERLLSISGNEVETLPSNEPDLIMNTIWFEAGQRYFIGGNELFQSLAKGGDWYPMSGSSPGFPVANEAIRGNAVNDIWMVGSSGMVMHFNGADWKLYDDQLLLPAGSGTYGSLDVNGHIVAIGGVHHSKGIVLIGKRE